MFTKSQVAFLLSAEKLFEFTSGEAYFWTFTFKKVYHDWQYPMLWHKFIEQLRDSHYGMCWGLRVIEPHKEHGLHYHAIMGCRVSVDLARRIGKRWGIGRVQVTRCNIHAAKYLSKYLTKRSLLYPGMRRWGTIGGFRAVKVNDIEVDSMFHRNSRKLWEGKKVGYRVTNCVMAQTRLYGEVHEWPETSHELVGWELENWEKHNEN